MKTSNLEGSGSHPNDATRGRRSGVLAGAKGMVWRDASTESSGQIRDMTVVGLTFTDNDDGTGILSAGGGAGTGTPGWANPKDFGATGDGTTDDTTAIQDAIDAMCTANIGGVIYFPRGTYLISATLTVTCDSLWLVGDGVSSVILAAPGMTASNMVSITGDKGGMRDIDLTSAAQKTGGAGVLLTGTQAVSLDHVRLDNQYDAIKVVTSTIFRAVDLDIRETSRHGIWFDGATGNDFYLSRIVADNGTPATGNGIFISGGDALIADHCDFLHFANGLLIEPTAGRTSEWHFLDSMIFDSCTNDGIHIGGAGDVLGATFVNCWASSCSGHGVYTGGGAGAVQGITITSSRFIANGKHGMDIALPTTRVSLAENLLVSNSQSASTTYDGIRVEAGITHIEIIDNHAYNGLGQTSTQAYGVRFASGATDYLVLDGNDFSGNVTGEVSNLAGVTGTHQLIGGSASTTPGTTGQFWGATTGDVPSWQTPTPTAPTAAQVRDAGRWEPTVDGGTDTLIFDNHTVVMDWTTT